MQQANCCVWFQPSPPSAVTATNVAENAVVDCTDSVVKPARTATTQCSASAMIVLPPSNVRRMSRAKAQGGQAPGGKAQGVRHGRCWGGVMEERKVWKRKHEKKKIIRTLHARGFQTPRRWHLGAARPEGVACRDSKPIRLRSANVFQNRRKQGVHYQAGRISFDEGRFLQEQPQR